MAHALSDALIDRSLSVFAVLRRVRPMIATRRYGLVTRADDVRAVLADHTRFTVAHYEPKMTSITGPFILGLDDTPLYRRDHAALRAAIRAEDVERLGQTTLTEARRRVAGAHGHIDVISELADPTIDHVITEYFGTPGPDTPTQLRWARNLFEEIFLNPTNKPAIHDRALRDAADMRPYIDRLIATRRELLNGDTAAPDDVLTRLLSHRTADGGLHDIAIRHNLIGLIAGWIPTVSKAFASAIDELLRRPEELQRAQHAARVGSQQEVAAYVFEALRFQPQTWAILRTCVEDCTVAEGTRRATRFRAGSKVLVATQSAMFDPLLVETPDIFRVDRPWSDYLHFGHGLHTCFGLAINRVHLAAMATALLEGPPISRKPGDAGQLTVSGAYPTHLKVAIAPSAN
jgi:cytochrome P450